MHSGWIADSVSGGMQAVEWVKKAQALGEAYDVVLMDWRMSDMDGLSAAQSRFISRATVCHLR